MFAWAAAPCGAQAKISAAIMPNNGGASQSNIVVSYAGLLD
jgi:hypothetical protein